MFLNFAQRLRDYRTRREISDYLSRMDERDLNDIGLLRSDVDLVVRKGRLSF